jgi:hypothetical protein
MINYYFILNNKCLIQDFFQENLWSRLPTVWRNFLEEITSEEIGKWILKESGRCAV